jgi:hypothetical protein
MADEFDEIEVMIVAGDIAGAAQRIGDLAEKLDRRVNERLRAVQTEYEAAVAAGKRDAQDEANRQAQESLSGLLGKLRNLKAFL